ncbi:MAG: hypothetical protein QNJ46_24035 [Leptolyngbyaceae cyanobacterium MO_188.B28]|nr:hypothetical protein [Leptolyngbyaceae cyanobacterium MO_188.B28]
MADYTKVSETSRLPVPLPPVKRKKSEVRDLTTAQFNRMSGLMAGYNAGAAS